MSDLTLDSVKSMAKNPVAFIEGILGAQLWHKQKQIAQSVADNRVTAVRSSHGTGKTHVSARIALWWLMTRPYSIVITTAPTARQVTELLWKEIRVAYKGAARPLGGELLPKASGLTVDDGWKMMGFSTDDPVNFQGHHAPGGVLVIMDEAPGVAPPIWDAVKAVLVGPEDHLLAIGNPVEANGPFYDLFMKPGAAECHHVSAYDVPNVVEGKEIYPGLCSREWVEQMKEDWGEGTPMWQSRVLGEFPDIDDTTLVPLSWIGPAVKMWHAHNDAGRWDDAPIRIGVDVARFGEDRTVFADCNMTMGVKSIRRYPKQDTMTTAGAVMRKIKTDIPEQVRIDADGLGAGVFDRVNEQETGPTKVVEMRGGMKASDPERYANLRSEWYWTLRQRLDPASDSPIALPDDENLKWQLTSIKFGLTSKGQVKIESKDDMRKRGVKSPDDADAVMYGMADTDTGFDIIEHLKAVAR